MLHRVLLPSCQSQQQSVNRTISEAANSVYQGPAHVAGQPIIAEKHVHYQGTAYAHTVVARDMFKLVASRFYGNRANRDQQAPLIRSTNLTLVRHTNWIGKRPSRRILRGISPQPSTQNENNRLRRLLTLYLFHFTKTVVSLNHHRVSAAVRHLHSQFQ